MTVGSLHEDEIEVFAHALWWSRFFDRKDERFKVYFSFRGLLRLVNMSR
jgi:hypothetical protein